MGDVGWMVAIMAAQAFITAAICFLLEKKTTCIDQNKDGTT